MTEHDAQFLSDVKALSDNGTLHRVLEMLEQDCIDRWKNSSGADMREEVWRLHTAIQLLKGRIASLCDDERVKNFNYRRRIS